MSSIQCHVVKQLALNPTIQHVVRSGALQRLFLYIVQSLTGVVGSSTREDCVPAGRAICPVPLGIYISCVALGS